MTRSKLIAKRVREVLLDGRWIANTNIKEQIENVTWEQAILQVASLNTIAALTFHVNYFLGGLNNVFDGGDLEIRDKFSFDLPPIHSASDWNKLLQNYLSNAEKFITHVEKMEDAKLDEPFVKEQYGTFQRNIEGVIEHSYYHLGQMAIITKMLKEN